MSASASGQILPRDLQVNNLLVSQNFVVKKNSQVCGRLEVGRIETNVIQINNIIEGPGGTVIDDACATFPQGICVENIFGLSPINTNDLLIVRDGMLVDNMGSIGSQINVNSRTVVNADVEFLGQFRFLPPTQIPPPTITGLVMKALNDNGDVFWGPDSGLVNAETSFPLTGNGTPAARIRIDDANSVMELLFSTAAGDNWTYDRTWNMPNLSGNTFWGNGSGSTTITGINNTLIGQGNTLSANANSNTTVVGQGSIGVGPLAVVVGSGIGIADAASVVVGQGASSTMDGVAIGQGASAADDGVAVGEGSVASATSSTALGNQSNASGTNSVAVGADSTSSGTDTVVVGPRAGNANLAQGNVIVGCDAAANGNSGTLFSVMLGPNAGENGLAVQDCIYVGRASGRFNQTNRNTFIGAQTATRTTPFSRNVFVGASAGERAVSCVGNVFIGESASRSNDIVNNVDISGTVSGVCIGTASLLGDTVGSNSNAVAIGGGRTNVAPIILGAQVGNASNGAIAIGGGNIAPVRSGANVGASASGAIAIGGATATNNAAIATAPDSIVLGNGMTDGGTTGTYVRNTYSDSLVSLTTAERDESAPVWITPVGRMVSAAPYDPVVTGEIVWTPSVNINSTQASGTQFVRAGNIVYMTGAWTCLPGGTRTANDPTFIDPGQISFPLASLQPYPVGAGPNRMNQWQGTAWFFHKPGGPAPSPATGSMSVTWQIAPDGLRIYNTSNIPLTGLAGTSGDAIGITLYFVVV
jgi:hypothetical protein